MVLWLGSIFNFSSSFLLDMILLSATCLETSVNHLNKSLMAFEYTVVMIQHISNYSHINSPIFLFSQSYCVTVPASFVLNLSWPKGFLLWELLPQVESRFPSSSLYRSTGCGPGRRDQFLTLDPEITSAPNKSRNLEVFFLNEGNFVEFPSWNHASYCQALIFITLSRSHVSQDYLRFDPSCTWTIRIHKNHKATQVLRASWYVARTSGRTMMSPVFSGALWMRTS